MIDMSLCSMPYEEHDEYPTLWSEKRVKVRKEHMCYECAASITLGESAGKFDSLYDGSWFTCYRCAACLILAELVATLTGACPLLGGLYESVENCNMEMNESLPSPREHRRRWEEAGEEG